MSFFKICALAVVGVVALFVIGYAGSVLNFRSDCIKAENGIQAQYEQDKNNYDNMWKKFKEASQVTMIYTDDLKTVYDSAIQGRYGKDGAKAMFQFIKEHNPNFDSSVYSKLQVIIESGRNLFVSDQQQLLDRKRQYKDLLGSTQALASNMWLGFPRINLDQYSIITSDDTEKAFKDKGSDQIKLR